MDTLSETYKQLLEARLKDISQNPETVKPIEELFEVNILLQISNMDFGNTIFKYYKNRGGVYKIIAIEDGERIPVNRFLGTDTEGVLYIGKATSFINRVIDLKKSIAPPPYKGTSHICGRRYKSIPSIAAKFPYELLYVEFFLNYTPEVKERELLTEYINRFGEVPPLNAI